MKTRTLLLVCILVVLLCTQADAKIIYVDDDASGANNGSSWQNAYIYLQDALTETENLENPALVLVAQGIYYPDLGGKIKPRDNAASFYLTEGVKLCGGYAGIACPDPNARDVQQYETILCGNDNTYRVVTAKAVNSDTIIDGFTITSSKDTYSSGGGIYLRENGNITVRNCLFYFNETHGIYSESSSPTVTGCTFENNNGGIFIRYGNAKITDCMFTNNTSSLGGGIYCIETLLYLENCIFMRNKVIKVCYRCPITTGAGGALYCNNGLSGSTIKNCIFYENTAASGGGVYLGEPYTALPVPYPNREKKFLLIDCSFIRNHADDGAAFKQILYTTQIENSTFCENHASDEGGAIQNTYGTLNLNNCFFGGNSAGSSGSVAYTRGIHFSNSPAVYFFNLSLRNCTLVDNISPTGRTIFCRSDYSEDLDISEISNCIIRNGGNEIYNPNGSHIIIDHTNLLGGLSLIDDPCNLVIWGVGNIDTNPLFVNPGYWDPNGTPEDANDDFWIEGDYHLKSQAGRWDPNTQSWVQDDVTSPCIDAGDPNSPIVNEPFPNGGYINMGAYGGTSEASKSYFGEPLCETIVAGDINGDCKVDELDWEIMLLHWLEEH